MKKEEIIRVQFQNILDKLVESKIQPTATAIISAEQPMILLFEELMCEINKLQKELEEKTTILMAGADKVKQLEKENEKLKKQVRNEIYVRDSIASLNSNLKQEIKNIIEKSYNDIDYFNRDMRKDFENLIRGK